MGKRGAPPAAAISPRVGDHPGAHGGGDPPRARHWIGHAGPQLDDGRLTAFAYRFRSPLMDTSKSRSRSSVTTLADPKIVLPAIGSAFAKLDPRKLMKNPVMFVVEVVAALTAILFVRDL